MPSLRQVAGLVIAAALTTVDAAPSPLSRTPRSPRSPPPSRKRAVTPLPAYATAFAPVSYLYSGESWWPSDVATHLQNTIPEVDFAAVSGYSTAGSATLATLDTITGDAYLTSKDNTDTDPAWLVSTYGKPSTTAGGYSAAPGTIIAVQKNATWVDVFYFYFYSYNYGGTVLGLNFDDHVGDWEHTMIRFVDGKPTAMYFSQHSSGSAYTWDALTKGTSGVSANRPLTYIGVGGHANYAKPGTEEYTIALGLIEDHTDAGFAWDMAQNYRGYWYDMEAGTFSEAGGVNVGGTEEATGLEGASWLQWTGCWGDEQYPDSRSGQYCIFGECHYTSGPTGPVEKNLGRTAMCQKETDCDIYTSVNDLTHQDKRTVTRS